MPICNALMTKAYNLTCKAITCKAITCIKAMTVSGFMFLSPYLKRQTASKWQLLFQIINYYMAESNYKYYK